MSASARVGWKKIFWHVLIAVVVAGQAEAQIVISEIMYDPPGDENKEEYLEIVNIGEASVNLADWMIGDGLSVDEITGDTSGTTIKAGQYGLILDPDYYTGDRNYDPLPSAALVLTITSKGFGRGNFSNSTARTISLMKPDSSVVDTVLYALGNTPGHSSERKTLSQPSLPSNWQQSRNIGGTPGATNSSLTDVAPPVVLPQPERPVKLTVSPRPAFGPVTISYQLPASEATVSVTLFAQNGRIVRRLAHGRALLGADDLIWDTLDDSGRAVPTGRYIVHLSAVSSDGRIHEATTTAVVARRR